MGFEKYSRMPLALEKNRMKRAFTGGKLLDLWQNIPGASDGNMSEEWLVSDIEIMNPGKETGEGLSKTRLPGGIYASLKEIISSDPAAFLGEEYVRKYGATLGVLSRAGDTKIRLVLQVHPDEECAGKYFGYRSGKTEAWYIVGCRDGENGEPHVYAGLKPGVTREEWRGFFDRHDTASMLGAMHKVPIKKGDVILIEAGMPHAMGGGSLFLELHEPSDYTLRLEHRYLPDRDYTDMEMHYGAGYDNLFNCISFRTYTEQEIRGKIIKTPVTLHSGPGVTESALITYEDTPRFKVNKLAIDGEHEIKSAGVHKIAVVTVGNGVMAGEYGEVSISQGQGVFLPAYFGSIRLSGRLELLVCDPPRL